MMLADDAYDFAIANVGEDWFFGRPDGEERLNYACDRLAAIIAASPKPVAVVLGATETMNPRYRALVDSVRDGFTTKGVAVYPSPERAAWAFGRVAP
jgi:hypothetical protein